MSNPNAQNAAPVITPEQIRAYKYREHLRFNDGTYTMLPTLWLESWWFRYGVADRHGYDRKSEALRLETGERWVTVPTTNAYTNHFAHISTEDGGCVAFTENDIKGVADRQTRMKPGRYLKKFFGDCLTDDQIRDIATAFMAECAPVELKFAETAADIERVYTHGPRSCMSHSVNEFNGHVHPTAVYGNSDVQIAYFERGEDDVKARAIVWPKKKIYGRTYGDSARLIGALKTAGYAEAGLGGFEGARLRAIQNEHGDGWIMPYVDEVGSADQDGKWFILRRRGEFDCQSTSGTIEDESTRCQCEHCGDRMHEDDTYSVDGHDGYYCASCYTEQFVECERTERMVHRDDTTTLENGEVWSDRAFERYGFVCDRNSGNYSDNEAVTMANGETWSEAAFEAFGFECAATGENYPIEELVTLADGTLWHQDHFDAHGYVDDNGDNVRNDDAPADTVAYRCPATLEMPLASPVVEASPVTVTLIDPVEYRVAPEPEMTGARTARFDWIGDARLVSYPRLEDWRGRNYALQASSEAARAAMEAMRVMMEYNRADANAVYQWHVDELPGNGS